MILGDREIEVIKKYLLSNFEPLYDYYFLKNIYTYLTLLFSP